jgi:hypothetical protein
VRVPAGADRITILLVRREIPDEPLARKLAQSATLKPTNTA